MRPCSPLNYIDEHISKKLVKHTQILKCASGCLHFPTIELHYITCKSLYLFIIVLFYTSMKYLSTCTFSIFVTRSCSVWPFSGKSPMNFIMAGQQQKNQSTLDMKDLMNPIWRNVFYSTTTEYKCKITLSHWLLLYHSLPPPIFPLSPHLRRCQQPLCSSRCRRSRSETPGSETEETITINIISNQISLHKCVQGLHKSDDDECVWHVYLQKKMWKE